MLPTDLAFFTTEELVAELMRRKTFLGVVVHAEQNLKSSAWQAERMNFRVHFNSNLDQEEASRLLDVVAASLEAA